MSDRTSSWLPRIVLVLILAAALGLRLQKAWASTSELLTHTTTDDAYYYFEIARNIVDGNHVTFDGEHVTNGFHPLWLVMVLPIFVIDDRLLAVHLALTLGALLGVATVALLYATVRRLIASEPAALLAAGAYAVHPAAVQDSVAGVESAASAFTLSVALLLFINLMDDTGAGRRGGRFRWGWFGLACGAVILARTDSFLLVIAMYAALALMVCRAGRPRDERPLLGFALGTTAVAVTPWLVWSWLATGSIVQVSARAGPLLTRQAFTFEHGDAILPKLRHGVGLTVELLRKRLPHSFIVPSGWRAGPMIALVLLVAALALWGLYARDVRGRRRLVRSLGIVAVPLSGALAALVIDAGVRWHLRPWYFAQTTYLGVLAGSLIVAAGAAIVNDVLPRRPLAPALYAVVVLFAAYVVRPGVGDSRFALAEPHQTSMYEAALWLRANTPPGTRVGAFNAGIFGYFSERTVVNLDGVVNEEAYDALRTCTTAQYIRAEGLDYLVDGARALTLAYCGATSQDVYAPVASFPVPASSFVAPSIDVLQVKSPEDDGQ